jgi:hypothetical protein
MRHLCARRHRARCVRLCLTFAFTWLLAATTSAQSISPNGASTPAVPSIVDSSLGVWTIGSQQQILRNGAHIGGGYGSRILWLDGAIYVLGDDFNWWRWTGAVWTFAGPTMPAGASAPPPPASTGGSSSPPAATQSQPPPPVATGDCAATWTLSGHLILRNGANTGGLGYEIVCAAGNVYVLGDDFNWWHWNAGVWTFAGPAMPAGSSVLASSSGTTPPPGSPAPPASSTARFVVFSPSADHASNVDSYQLQIVSAGSDQVTAASVNLGKPPVVNGECSVDISALLSNTTRFFDAYVAILTAVNGYGSSAPTVSAPFTW